MKLRRSQLGFTTIELMTTVVVAGILLTVALPAFNDMLARRRLEGQANELVIDLSYAKSEAVQRNVNVVVITGGGGSCYIVAISPPTGCDCAGTPCASQLKLVRLSNGATVTDGVTFDFEPVRGTAAAASAVIALGSRNYTVAVAANGRVGALTP